MSGPVTLVEARPLDPATGAEQVLRFSAGVQGAPVYDGEIWQDRLLGEASTEIAIFENEFEETGSRPANGEITLAAGDAGIDAALLLAWAGARVRVWTGNEEEVFAAFTLEYDGAASGLVYDEGRASIRLRDRSILMDEPLLIPTFAGSGGAEGGDDLAGKRKQCVFGPAVAVAPDLVDPVNLIYQVHYRRISAINLVTDQAVALTFSGDNVADYAALVALSVPEGQYATARAVGMLKTGRRPSGLFVVDVDGDAEPTYVSSAAKILERIIDAGLLDKFATADRDQPSFDAVETANSAAVALVVPRGAQASEVFDAVMRSYGGFWQLTDLGKIEIDIIGFGASVATLTEDDILSIGGLETKPPVWSLGLDYAPVWRVHRSGEFNEAFDNAPTLALKINVDADGAANIGEAALTAVDAFGNADFTGDGSIFWDGAKITVARVQGLNVSLATGQANIKGFICLETALTQPFTVGAVPFDIAFVHKVGAQWKYDNNFVGINFTPTPTMVALGWMATGAADFINSAGLFGAPVSLELAAFPAADVTSSSQFAPALAWNFENSADTWTQSNIIVTLNSAFVGLVANAHDPNWRTPNGLSLIGATAFLVRARIRRTAGSSWQGACFYRISGGHGESGSFLKTIPDTSVINQWVIVEWDMSDLTVGGTDWLDNTITGIRLDIGLTTGDNFDVDWIAVGRISANPGAAAIQYADGAFVEDLQPVDAGATANTGALADKDTVANADIDNNTIEAAKLKTDLAVGLASIVPGSLSFGIDETDATVRTIINFVDGETFSDWTTVFAKSGHRIIINIAEVIVARANVPATLVPLSGQKLYRRVDGGAPVEIASLAIVQVTSQINRVIVTDLVDSPGDGNIEYRIGVAKTWSNGHDNLDFWDAHIDVEVLFSK